MAQSKEYPDLKWVEPKGWGSGRDGKAVRYIVIHYTAGSERSTSAEDGAAYDKSRTDGTSTHYFVDQNSIIQCVLTKDRANAARKKGNRLGIQYELCGTVQTREQWLDTASLSTLKLAAKQVARDCKKYGIPARRLTVSETRRAWDEFPDGPKGIVGHVDCTNAYPEDGGDHTDPGSAFPWDVFLKLVREEMQENQVATQFSDDDKAILKAQAKDGVDDLLVLVPFATGGGSGSPVGNSVLGHGYPRRPGESRKSMWENLQTLQVEVDRARDNAAAAALNANDAARAVAFLADDFPNDGNPEDDPIVKRLRYVLAHPTPSA